MTVKKKIIAKKKVVKKSVPKKKSLVSPKKTISKRAVKSNTILETSLETNMTKPAQSYGHEILNEEIDTEDNNNIIYSWKAPEFLYHEKSLIWHIAVYSFIIIITAVMFFLKQWLAIPVFSLIAVLIYQYAETKPKNIDVFINDLGILVKDKFYPFSEMKVFWILYNPPLKQLNIEITKRFSPVISILLDDADSSIVKDILSIHVMEDDKRTEDFFDKIIRMLRF